MRRNVMCKKVGVCLTATVVLCWTFSLAFVMATPLTKASDEHVETLFDVSTPSGSPFPSDRFTVPDASQLTGLRVNLPKPDCVASPSDCQDIDILNTVDGFNLQPRLS